MFLLPVASFAQAPGGTYCNCNPDYTSCVVYYYTTGGWVTVAVSAAAIALYYSIMSIWEYGYFFY